MHGKGHAEKKGVKGSEYRCVGDIRTRKSGNRTDGIVGRTPGPRGSPWTRSSFGIKAHVGAWPARGRPRTRGSAPQFMQNVRPWKTMWHRPSGPLAPLGGPVLFLRVPHRSRNYLGMTFYRRRLPHLYAAEEPVFLTWASPRQFAAAACLSGGRGQLRTGIRPPWIDCWTKPGVVHFTFASQPSPT